MTFISFEIQLLFRIVTLPVEVTLNMHQRNRIVQFLQHFIFSVFKCYICPVVNCMVQRN